ncbi:MAG TPA: ATP-binding cassette domain-containing protein [Bryobacteraceae bacterium]|nr:ATP-binding cassette domain-containing protein [Bryobacteraceae bacterium]
MPESILRFERVTVSFDGNPALEDVTFDLPEGESRVILGAAGSGKTVMLKACLGLVCPEKGSVFLFGEDITNLKEEQLFKLRARTGMLFQESALFDSLTIEENVAYPLENQQRDQRPPEELRPVVEEILRSVELENTLEKLPSELSGGMRRRVGIARANVTKPDLVLYDSPTAGLDPITANTIMALIVMERDLRKATTMIVTQRFQDGQIMARYRYDPAARQVVRATRDGGEVGGIRFMVLKDGRLVFEGTLQELEQSTDPYISQFVLRH